MPWLHELLCRVRPAGRHSLDHPRPGQRPAAEYGDEWPEDDLDEVLVEVLAPPLVALHRALGVPTSPFPAISRDGWPYNLRSV